MDIIKESFRKVKEDMDFLREELNSLKEQIKELEISLKTTPSSQIPNSQIPTNPPLNPAYSRNIPTHNRPFNPLKPQNLGISSGNEGVPTDKQTNQQTNQHIIQQTNSESRAPINTPTRLALNKLERAKEILDNLDALKKELRIKFKSITPQELAVFSALYQLDDEKQEVDYNLLASRLNLSESSIRDYIIKIQKKGIPILKEKLNNKRIILHISEELRRIASLETILKLRTL